MILSKSKYFIRFTIQSFQVVGYKSKIYKIERLKIFMKKLIAILFIFLLLNVVDAALRESAEEAVQNITVPQNIGAALPLDILINLTDTGESFTLHIEESGVTVVDPVKSDIIVNSDEETFRDVHNEDNAIELLSKLEAKPDSFKGTVALIAIEKTTNIEIVKKPSLFYRILRWILKWF